VDEQIAIIVLRPESWWDEPAILDPATGTDAAEESGQSRRDH
jgi:hypothetical protein